MTDDELLGIYSVGYGEADAPSERHTFGIRAVEAAVRRKIIEGLPNLIMLMFSNDLDLDYSYEDIEERVKDVMDALKPDATVRALKGTTE